MLPDQSWIEDMVSVNLTSFSLLERLRTAPPNAPAWQRFHELYFPVIRAWLNRVPGLGVEVEDLAQEVFLILCRELAKFHRQRDGSFRVWLRGITLNRIRSFQKSRRKRPVVGGGAEIDHLLSQLEDSTSEPAQQWDRDHDKHLFDRLLALVRSDFEPATWEAFIRFALDGEPAARVAAQIGISESAVMQAKFRVLKRLREEAGDFLD